MDVVVEFDSVFLQKIHFLYHPNFVENLFVFGFGLEFALFRGDSQINIHLFKGTEKFFFLKLLIRFQAMTDDNSLFDIDLSQFDSKHPSFPIRLILDRNVNLC